jgi:O-antigen ligase
MLDQALRRPVAVGTIAVLVAVNAGLGAMLASARPEGVALAVLPVIVVASGALIASNRAILIFAAFALVLFVPITPTDALPFPGGITVYPSDLLVLLAVASWVAASLTRPAYARPSWPEMRLLGWPLLLFGIVLFTAIVRGHERYGEKLVSVPVRFFLYAGIAAAVTDLKPRAAYRGLVGLFYVGVVWQALVALYGYATGWTVDKQGPVSTGGERVLAGSTAMFMAGALLLALLNLEFDRSARRTALHLVMAGLATFALASTLARTTFAAVGLLVPFLLLAFRRIRLRAAVFLPLCAPFLVLIALLVPRAAPSFFPTLAHRVTASPATDTSARWREKAISAVWTQVREAPLTGVGFGRTASFEINQQRITITQDPHNQFIYLWAAGGLLLLGSFVLLLIVYLAESWRRFKSGTTNERRFIFWTASLWFVLLVNSASGIVLTDPLSLLVFWILMLLPMIVRRPQETGLGTAG